MTDSLRYKETADTCDVILKYVNKALVLLHSYNRKSEKQRTKEYKQELGAMKERVSRTPLLLERATQVCTLSFVFYIGSSIRVYMSS